MNHIALTVLTLDQLTLLPSSILPFVPFFQFVSVFRSMTELDIERSISFDSNVFASTDFVLSGKDQSDSARRIIRWTNCIKLFCSKAAGVPSCSIEFENRTFDVIRLEVDTSERSTTVQILPQLSSSSKLILRAIRINTTSV